MLRLCWWSVFLVSAVSAEYKTGISVIPFLKTDTTSLGQMLIYPKTDRAEITVAKVIIPPGKETGWHKHLFPVAALVVQGTLTINFEKHDSRQFLAGESFAEVVDVYHNGKNRGNEDVILTVFFMGEKNQPLSEKRKEQK